MSQMVKWGQMGLYDLGDLYDFYVSYDFHDL